MPQPKDKLDTSNPPMIDKVSIIIPCHNHGKYLGEAIESAQLQSHSNTEIIVVLDGCTDDSEAVANKYEVQIIKLNLPYGPSMARNVGVKHSKGNWLLFLDADDVLHPKFIERCLGNYKVIGSPKKVAIVATDYKEFGKQNRVFTLNRMFINHIALLRQNVIPVTALVKKTAFNKVNGFDEGLIVGFEDWDLWLRITQQFDCMTVPEILFYYRKHDVSRNAKAILQYESIKKQILNKIKNS